MAQGIYTPFQPVVLITADNGAIEIPQPTPLKRLHYFDGKFLRADDLSLEQTYVRELVRHANKAGGSGVVHGLDTTLSGAGAEILIGPGMAFDPAGRILLLVNREYRFDLDDLIARSTRVATVPSAASGGAASFEDCVIVDEQPPAVTLSTAQMFYVITVSFAEALCGQEAVYGKICEEACITSKDRPYVLEGVLVRAVPLTLRVPLQNSAAVTIGQKHLRSRVASAVFAGDRLEWPTLISGDGVQSETWCLGAEIACGNQVPLAVVARSGGTTLFLDAWTVRRERMEPPPRRYWAARMSMRPWNAFLAQVLQFQCQLHELLDGVKRFPPSDLCGGMRDDVREVAHTLGLLKNQLAPAKGLVSITQLGDAQRRLDRHLAGTLIPSRTGSVLIDGGIVELPPAGYLPVQADQIVNDQVVALLGTGVDLRFCRVTADFVPHALEEAQHMERISLITGLEANAVKPAVDILIPDGEPIASEAPARGLGFEGELSLLPEFAAALQPEAGDPGDSLNPDVSAFNPGLKSAYLPGARMPASSAINMLGAGRGEQLASGGGEFYFAGTSDAPAGLKVPDFVRAFTAIGTAEKPEDLAPLTKLKRVKQELHANVADGRFYQRTNAVGNEAMRYLAARKGDEVAAGIDTGSHEPWTTARQPGEQFVMAWTGLKATANPFALQVGQSTPVNMHVGLVMPGAKASWLEYRIAGELTVRTIQAGGSGAVALTGVVAGGSAFTRSTIDAVAQPDVHDTGPIVLRARLAPASIGQRLLVEVTHGKKRFDVEVSWATAPVRAHVEVNCTLGDMRLPLLSGNFRQNAAVLAPGNVWHGLALNAVYGVGSFLGGSDFVQQALALLFPEPPPPSAETRYRATRDWVLFHRRRVKVCGEQAVRTVVTPGRRYAIWETRAESVEQAVAIARAILANDPAHLPTFASIAPVEFGAATPVLQSSPDDLKMDWEQRAAGDILRFGIIASAGALDGSALAKARLDQVRQTLSTVVEVAADYMSEALAFVPAALTVPDTDGAIVFVTLVKPKQTCHTVYRVEGNADVNAAVLRNFHDAGAAAALLPVLLARAQVLGTVQFTQGVADLLPTPDRDAVKNQWLAQPGSTPALVLGFGSAADPMAGDAALVQARARSILTFLGDSGKALVDGEVVPGALTGCPAATFVFPALQQTTHRIYVVKVNTAATLFLGISRKLQLGEIADLVDQANVYTDVLFDRGTDHIRSVQDPLSLDFSGRVVMLAVYSRPAGGADLEPAATQVLQAAAIRGRFNAAPNSPIAAVSATPASWLENAIPHITLALVNEAGGLFDFNRVFGPQILRVPAAVREPARPKPARPKPARRGGGRPPKKPK